MAHLEMDEDEKKRFEAWKIEHYKICTLRPGTCGDLYHFRVCPSGIGTFLSVKCPCGAKEDLNGDDF
jgi:hypothetical protein